MPGGFWKDWGATQIKFGAATVTIVGGVVGIWIAVGYKWAIGFVGISVFGATVWLAFHEHRQRRLAETEKAQEASRAAELQRQLDNVNTRLVAEIAAHLAISRRDEFARDLIAYIDFVGRMRAFVDGLGEARPEIRRFVQQSNQLYIVAKVEARALPHLAVDDPFLLVKRDLKGVEVGYAHLVVHQSPNIEKNTAIFRVVELLCDGAQEIVQLAAAEKTPVSKQFEIRLTCEPGRYPNVDFPNLNAAIRRLLDDLADRERATP